MTTNTNSGSRLWQAARTYLTRGWAMACIAAAAVIFVLLLFAATFSEEAAPDNLPTLLGLPLLGMSFFLVHHSKWQFVSPRARLTPHFAAAHVPLLGVLVVLVVVVYPFVVGGINGLNLLGVAAYAAVLGSALIWGAHSVRPIWILIGVAIFFSLSLPQLSAIWLTSSPLLTALHLVCLVAGWTALGLWLLRLTRMSEEDDDYIIPVQAQIGPGSRVEKSEARRYMVRMLERAAIQTWISDTWHNRLAGQSARTDDQRRRLLRYGLAPVPAVVRLGFWLVLMASIVVIQVTILVTMLGGKVAENSGMLVVQFGVFMFMGPLTTSQLLAMRRARLAQELLLPLTRRSLVHGITRPIVGDAIGMMLLTCTVMFLFVAFVSPALLTVQNAAAVLFAALTVLPLLTASSAYCGLVRSGMARMLLLVGALYFQVGAAGGVLALVYHGYFVYAGLAGAILFGLGVLACIAVRWRWLAAEFG